MSSFGATTDVCLCKTSELFSWNGLDGWDQQKHVGGAARAWKSHNTSRSPTHSYCVVLLFTVVWIQFSNQVLQGQRGWGEKGARTGCSTFGEAGGGCNNKQQMKGAVESRKTGLSDPDSDPLKFQGRQLDWLEVLQNLIKFEMTQWTYFHTDILSVGQTTDETVAV